MPESKLRRRVRTVVCADGSQLILTTGVVATSAYVPSFASTVLSMGDTIGLPKTVLADASYASGQAIRDLRKKALIRWSPSDGPVPADLMTSRPSLKKRSHAGSPNPSGSP
ncbi:hypothetical protein AA18889_1457 [Acetobacter senegalensis DSM 18889]|nr:hypothetical protein AA18889_1457 [Acetobacter senegalensis DSM 18889]